MDETEAEDGAVNEVGAANLPRAGGACCVTKPLRLAKVKLTLKEKMTLKRSRGTKILSRAAVKWAPRDQISQRLLQTRH